MKVSIFITLHLFEIDLRRYARQTYLREKFYRSKKEMDPYTQLPYKIWNRFVLYNLVAIKRQGFVGCHKIAANLIFKEWYSFSLFSVNELHVPAAVAPLICSTIGSFHIAVNVLMLYFDIFFIQINCDFVCFEVDLKTLHNVLPYK